MNEIRNHPKNNKYFIVENPSEAAIDRVQVLVKGGWAKVQPNGWLIIHNNFRGEFEGLAAREETAIAIVPRLEKMDDIDRWADQNINSGKGRAWLADCAPRIFNEQFAGLTVAEVEEILVSIVKEIN